MAFGLTIQIYFPSGEPQGIRIADMTTRTIKAIEMPRTKLSDFFSRKESEFIGIYFLLGDPEQSIKQSVYVGQTEDLPMRLRKHHAEKEFWTRCVVVISSTQTFTQAHLKYLEWMSIKAINDANRYELENGNAGSKPYVTEALEAEVHDVFKTAEVLLATLGHNLFVPVAGKTPTRPEQVFYCKGPYTDARGALTDDGFVIFANSLSRRNTTPAAKQFATWIEKLIQKGILVVENEEQVRFTQDYIASSPSNAAALTLATHANGWNAWKRADGLSLHDVYRAEAETLSND